MQRQNTWRFSASLLIAGVVTLAAVAAQEPQQRQAEPQAPNPLGQPLLDGAGRVREDAFLRVPLAPEDKKYADLDGHRMKGFVREVIAISQKDRASGNLFWGRNVGTAGHVATQDWVEGYFRKHNLQNIHRQPFDLGAQWIPKAFDISFSPGGKTFKLDSARPFRSDSTPPGGIEWEVVWAGNGTAADFVGRDVKGKAVL